MSEIPYADISDLATWTGETIADDDARATAVLRAASVLVRTFVGSDVTEAWTEVPDDVATVVVQVAARVWANPNGAVSQTTGPFTIRYGEEADAGLVLTGAERDLLSPYRAKVSGLWTLGITRDDEYLDQYLEVVGQPNEPMPFLPADGRAV